MNSDRQLKVRFLLPVWGNDYVARWCRLALPALLAPGNLPAIAKATDFEFVLLTSEIDYEYIKSQKIFDKLSSMCSVHFISIDDLLCGWGGASSFYGLVLTNAYWRAIESAGDEMVDTHFIFMNADFLVANEGMRNLLARLQDGHHIVLTSTLRCNSEDVVPILTRQLSDGGMTLAVQPRALVDVALQHMHSTQVAKLVNSNICHSAAVNQLFWQVDDQTVVSHHYIPFMLCVKPERFVAGIEGFCDYAFVPELCPSGNSVALEDSDEFCMIELQARSSELDFLRIGGATRDEVAASLGQWTTRWQRDMARRHRIVFHAADLPPALDAACHEADDYVADIERRMTKPPQPHLDHPYWTGTLATLGLHPPLMGPPPAPTPPSPMQRWIRKLTGITPFVPPWHPYWLDFRNLAERITRWRAHDGGHGRMLYLRSPAGLFADALPEATTLWLDEIVSGRIHQSLAGLEPFSLILVEAGVNRNIRTDLEQLRPYLTKGGEIILFFHLPRYWRAGIALSYQMRRTIGMLHTVGLQRADLISSGGPGKRVIAILWDSLHQIQKRVGKAGVPVIIPLWVMLALVSYWVNHRERRAQDDRHSLRDCSSFLLTYRF